MEELKPLLDLDFLGVKLEGTDEPTSSSEDVGRDSTPFEILQIVSEYYRDSRGHLIVPKHKEVKTNSTETRYGAGLVVFNRTMYRPNYSSLRTNVTTARCLDCSGTIYVSPDGVVTLKKPCTPHSSANPFCEKRKGNYSKVLGPDAKILRKNDVYFGDLEAFPPRIDWDSLRHHLVPICDNSATFEIDQFLTIGFSNPESIDKIGKVESASFDVVYGDFPGNLMLILSSKVPNTENYPLLSVFLLDADTEPHFLRIFTQLQRIGFNPSRLCVSLNANCRNALRAVFPSANLRFCFKSFSNAIWRQIDSLKDAPPMALVQKFVSLAFVSLWQLDDYFSHLETLTLKMYPNLAEFCGWFASSFIGETCTFSRDEWNCWARIFENLPISNGIDHQIVRKTVRIMTVESFLKTQWFAVSIASESSLIFRLPVFRQSTCQRYPSPGQFFESVPPMLLR